MLLVRTRTKTPFCSLAAILMNGAIPSFPRYGLTVIASTFQDDFESASDGDFSQVAGRVRLGCRANVISFAVEYDEQVFFTSIGSGRMECRETRGAVGLVEGGLKLDHGNERTHHVDHVTAEAAQRLGDAVSITREKLKESRGSSSGLGSIPTTTGVPTLRIALYSRSTKCTRFCSLPPRIDLFYLDSTMLWPTWDRRQSDFRVILDGDRGVAQLGLARLLGVQEVAGSNPAVPTRSEGQSPKRVAFASRWSAERPNP